MAQFVYNSTLSREIDVLALKEMGISEIQLMDKAAESLFQKLLETWPGVKKIHILCGPGNNGGDGYLLASKAKRAGRKVRVSALTRPKSLIAKAAAGLAAYHGVSINPIDTKTLSSINPGTDLLVDALFGHGLRRDIEAPLIDLFKQLNKSPVTVFAVDVPSGLNSDTGAVMGAALQANRTHCLVALKIGLFTGNGPDYTGKISQDNLTIPEAVYGRVHPPYALLSSHGVHRVLPQADESSHKGSFGHTNIIGGQPGMFGAVILAASAAARSGAGRVTAHTLDKHTDAITLANPVVMTEPIDGEVKLRFPASTSSVVLGPGLGVDASLNRRRKKQNWSQQVFLRALEYVMEQELPLVVDADGLNLLAQMPQQYGQWVLTPHPKEAARLLQCSVDEIQADRPQAGRKIAKSYGGVCVLKGRGTLICAAEGLISVSQYGNWGMATAGSGDVLSGIVGAFLGYGLTPYNAAYAAVYVHSRAGDFAVKHLSKRSLLASDIVESLPHVFSEFE